MISHDAVNLIAPVLRRILAVPDWAKRIPIVERGHEASRAPGYPIVWTTPDIHNPREVRACRLETMATELARNEQRRKAFGALIGQNVYDLWARLRVADMIPRQRIAFDGSSQDYWGADKPLAEILTENEIHAVVAAWPCLGKFHVAIAHSQPPPCIQALLTRNPSSEQIDVMLAALYTHNGHGMLLNGTMAYLWNQIGRERLTPIALMLALNGCQDQRVLDIMGGAESVPEPATA